MPNVVLRGELYLAMSIPSRIRRHVPNVVLIGRAVWQLPQTFECVTPYPPPPMPPGVLWGDLYLAYVNSQMNPQTWTKVGANRSSRWQLPKPFECLTPKTPQVPPCVWRGNLFGVYPFLDGSADVCHIWCQSVQPFDSFPRLLNLWLPNPPPPQKCPLGYWETTCS